MFLHLKVLGTISIENSMHFALSRYLVNKLPRYISVSKPKHQSSTFQKLFQHTCLIYFLFKLNWDYSSAFSLNIAQMQGKFQMQILPQAGHAVHEDVPDRVAEVLASFLVRNSLRLWLRLCRRCPAVDSNNLQKDWSIIFSCCLNQINDYKHFSHQLSHG